MSVVLNVKSLRLRLGWTQSDLSRRLGCKILEISQWETGMAIPNSDQAGLLQLLFSQAEACNLDTHAAPRAEVFCQQKDLGQIYWKGLPEFDKN